MDILFKILILFVKLKSSLSLKLCMLLFLTVKDSLYAYLSNCSPFSMAPITPLYANPNGYHIMCDSCTVDLVNVSYQLAAFFCNDRYLELHFCIFCSFVNTLFVHFVYCNVQSIRYCTNINIKMYKTLIFTIVLLFICNSY